MDKIKKDKEGFTHTLKQSKVCGFTLVELLTVVAILGILLSITMVLLTEYRNRARDTKIQTQLKQVTNQVNLYNGETGEVLSQIFAKNINQFKEHVEVKNANIFHLNKPDSISAYPLLSEMPASTVLYYGWNGVHPNLGGKYFIATSSSKGAFCLDYDGNVKSYDLKEELAEVGGNYSEEFFNKYVIFKNDPNTYSCE